MLAYIMTGEMHEDTWMAILVSSILVTSIVILIDNILYRQKQTAQKRFTFVFCKVIILQPTMRQSMYPQILIYKIINIFFFQIIIFYYLGTAKLSMISM